MKRIKKIVAAVTLIASILCLSIMPASVSASTTDTSSTSQSSSWRIPCGSFIQDYMTASWSDARWQEELATMKEAGMNILIFSPSLMIDGNNMTTIYPSKVFSSASYSGVDRIDACLRNCEKAGVKVFIALNQDPTSGEGHYWSFGWNISTSQPDVLKQYWANNAKISNELADELYGMYKSKYPNAFYGWYWVHEFWNYTIITNAYEGKTPDDSTAADPSVYTDIIANDAFNPVLDHLTSLDPSMPMLFSSFKNPTLCKSSSYTRMWSDIIKNTHFRPGDIWAPMDGMGNDLTDFNTLDEWTAASKKAADVNKNLHFWINNELQVTYVDRQTGKSDDNDGEVALLDRTVKQIAITAKYAENNIFFTWNHYYSPYNTLPGYNETYMQYVNTGKIEKNAPNAVDPSGITVTKYGDGYLLKWKAPYDDVGVCDYNIYKDGVLLARIHPFRTDDTGTKPGIDLSYYLSESGTYEIEAYDFAGNVSPKTAFNTDGSPVTTTPTSSTGTTVTSASTTETQSIATGTVETVSTDTNATSSSDGSQAAQAEQATTQNPITGSTLPKVAVVLVLASAGLGFAVKTKRK